MSLRIEQQGQISRAILDGELTIYSATDVKDALMGELQRCQEMEIDLSGVEEVDTAGFQVLILAKREAAKALKTLRMVAHSPATLEVLELLDMSAYFGDALPVKENWAA